MTLLGFDPKNKNQGRLSLIYNHFILESAMGVFVCLAFISETLLSPFLPIPSPINVHARFVSSRFKTGLGLDTTEIRQFGNDMK